MNDTLYLGDRKKLDVSELMVTIIIIALLTAMAIPRIEQTRGTSKKSEAKAVLWQLYQLEHTHYERFEQYVPGSNTDDLIFSPLLIDKLRSGTGYCFSVVVDSTGFIVVATEINDADGDGIIHERLSIDHTGIQSGDL